MSARDQRLGLPERVATWQLARSYRRSPGTHRAGRKILRPLVGYHGRHVTRRQFFSGTTIGAPLSQLVELRRRQPEARSSCLLIELPGGNSMAVASAEAVGRGSRRP